MTKLTSKTINAVVRSLGDADDLLRQLNGVFAEILYQDRAKLSL